VRPRSSICAWCGKPLRATAVDTPVAPVSHGICAKCAAATGLFETEDLLDLTDAQVDALPLGVLELDPQGRVLRYNRSEERLSGLTRGRVLGRNFFLEVAPCTKVASFQGQYQEMVASGKSDPIDFDFVFRFPGGERLVHISISFDQRRQRGILLVSAAA
jgi:photoactive yellow protein